MQLVYTFLALSSEWVK